MPYKDHQQQKDNARWNNIRRRRLCLDWYGRECACCGEDIYEFLVIDHINGGGNKHRKEVLGAGNTGSIYHWLIKNIFPDGFQTLCHNCNMAKGSYGFCPHNKETDAITD